MICSITSMASRLISRVSILLLLCFPASTPKVYFKCNGEKKIVLPDVKKKDKVYTFRGEESFQPLTDFKSTKCKRCGVYDERLIKSDDVFDEWEFCPSDFHSHDGRYIRKHKKELNATFLCPDCVKKGTPGSSNKDDTHSDEEENGMKWSMIIIVGIIVVGSTVLLIMGLLFAYKIWQKRKRQQEQARFMKLFEDTDDIEDELGIGPLSDSI